MSEPSIKLSTVDFRPNQPFYYGMDVDGMGDAEYLKFNDLDRDGIVDNGELSYYKKFEKGSKTLDGENIDADENFIKKYGTAIQDVVAKCHKELPDEIDKVRKVAEGVDWDPKMTCSTCYGRQKGYRVGNFDVILVDHNEDGRYDFVQLQASAGYWVKISSSVLVGGEYGKWTPTTADQSINVYMDRLNLKSEK